MVPNVKSPFLEEEDGVLSRRNPLDTSLIQIVLTTALRPRLVRLSHFSPLDGHPGQTIMHRRIRRTYYWPQMVEYINKSIVKVPSGDMNIVRLIKKALAMKLFSARSPLESVSAILGPLPRIKQGFLLILVISDRSIKLTQVVPIQSITAYDIDVAFTEY